MKREKFAVMPRTMHTSHYNCWYTAKNSDIYVILQILHIITIFFVITLLFLLKTEKLSLLHGDNNHPTHDLLDIGSMFYWGGLYWYCHSKKNLNNNTILDIAHIYEDILMFVLHTKNTDILEKRTYSRLSYSS